jgi:hypothetical protein
MLVVSEFRNDVKKNKKESDVAFLTLQNAATIAKSSLHFMVVTPKVIWFFFFSKIKKNCEHRLQIRTCAKEGRNGTGQYFEWMVHQSEEKNVLESTSYPLVCYRFTEWYAKPQGSLILICLPCCAIWACSEVGI